MVKKFCIPQTLRLPVQFSIYKNAYAKNVKFSCFKMNVSVLFVYDEAKLCVLCVYDEAKMLVFYVFMMRLTYVFHVFMTRLKC